MVFFRLLVRQHASPPNRKAIAKYLNGTNQFNSIPILIFSTDVSSPSSEYAIYRLTAVLASAITGLDRWRSGSLEKTKLATDARNGSAYCAPPGNRNNNKASHQVIRGLSRETVTSF